MTASDGREPERIESNENDRTIFALVGEPGGVHFWAQRSSAIIAGIGDEYYGGIESHKRTKPDWSDNEKPDNEDCWLLKGPCWHDGSSLQASEYYIPLWKLCRERNDYEPLWAALMTCYRRHFMEPNDA